MIATLKMCSVFVVFLLLMSGSYVALSQTPAFDGVWQIGSTGNDQVVEMEVDASGNVYATGRFSGTVDFDPTAGEYNLTAAGTADLFVLKTDADGNLLWAVRAGSASGGAPGSAIAVDASGNVYIAGTFNGTVDFDPGPDVFNLSTTVVDDIYVLKLDASGNFGWAVRMGGNDSDLGSSLALDNAGNVYVTGGFRATADFDPGPGTFNMTALALYDIYVVKLSASGTFIWAKQASGFGSENASDIVIDPSGNVLLTGTFQVTVDFDPGPDTYSMAPGGGANQIFVWKLSAAGDLMWAKQMGSTSDDSGYAIATDSDGNVYTTGTFQGTADLDPGAGTANLTSNGSRDAFVSKLSADGDYLWAKGLGGTLDDYGFSIRTNAQRDVYLGGYFFGTSDFDPGAGTFSLASNGGTDGFVCKLDASGNFILAFSFGGTLDDNTLSSVVNESGDIITGVTFRNTVDFDFGAASAERTSAGSADIAILKVVQVTGTGPVITSFSPTSAMVGETIIISGSGFSAIAAENIVNFNSVNAVVSTSSINSLTVTVPDDATSGPIKITVGANSTMSASDFTVTPTPVIAITTQPIDAAVCPEGTGQLAVEASGTTNITYRWQRFNSITSTFEDLINASGYSGATTKTLTIDLSNGGQPGDYRARVNGDFAAEVFSNVAAVDLRSLPSAPVVASVTADGTCGPVSLSIDVTSPEAGEFRWYDVQNRNFPFLTETSGVFETPPLSASTTYFVSYFDGVCESVQTSVTASVNYQGPGALDPAFSPPASGEGNISLFDVMRKQPDGKLLVSNYEAGGIEYELCRFLTDGSLDPDFKHWSEDVFSSSASPIGLLPDGKIVLAGSFTSIDGKSLGRIAMFNADGTMDLTFNSTSPGFNGPVGFIEIQSDGKILATGVFTSYNGTAVNKLVRLNADGSLDNTFSTGSGPDDVVRVISVQPDKKILIGGQFNTYNGVAISGIARLNADGSLDGSFQPAAGVNPLVITTQADNKILVGGAFSNVGGLSRNGIVRLNADGSVDTSFDPGTGADDAVYAIYEEPSGKILSGGWFQTFNGQNKNFLVRLMPDGSVDEFFDPGIGPYSLVTNIIPYSENRVYVGGYISHWNGNLHNGIGLVNNDCIRKPEGFDNSSCDGTVTLTACGGIDGQYRWYTDASGGAAIAGETSSTLALTNISTTTTYYVSLQDAVCESARVPVVATVLADTPPQISGVSVCAGSTATLTASGASNGQYRWYDVAAGGTAIAGAVNDSFTTPVVMANTSYYVSIHNGTCEGPRAEVVVEVNAVPSPPSAADISVCKDEGGQLTATGGSSGSYRWYDDGLVVIPDAVDGTMAIPPLISDTRYFVSIVNNGCESELIEMNVTVVNCNANTPPVINATTLVAQIGGSVSLDLSTILNDADGNIDMATLQIVNAPSSGAVAVIEGDGSLTVDYANRMYSGLDQLTIRVCDASFSCTEAVITIEVMGDLIIYNAVSPNGDGLNDILRIEYIDVLEDTRRNNVTIFNRWGDKVFEVADYDNINHVFRGVGDGNAVLPSGTYFYSIQFMSGRKSKKGYLSLRR